MSAIIANSATNRSGAGNVVDHDDLDEFARTDRANCTAKAIAARWHWAPEVVAALPRLAMPAETKGTDVEIKTPDGCCRCLFSVHPAKGKLPWCASFGPDIFWGFAGPFKENGQPARRVWLFGPWSSIPYFIARRRPPTAPRSPPISMIPPTAPQGGLMTLARLR